MKSIQTSLWPKTQYTFIPCSLFWLRFVPYGRLSPIFYVYTVELFWTVLIHDQHYGCDTTANSVTILVFQTKQVVPLKMSYWAVLLHPWTLAFVIRMAGQHPTVLFLSRAGHGRCSMLHESLKGQANWLSKGLDEVWYIS